MVGAGDREFVVGGVAWMALGCKEGGGGVGRSCCVVFVEGGGVGEEDGNGGGSYVAGLFVIRRHRGGGDADRSKLHACMTEVGRSGEGQARADDVSSVAVSSWTAGDMRRDAVIGADGCVVLRSPCDRVRPSATECDQGELDGVSGSDCRRG